MFPERQSYLVLGRFVGLWGVRGGIKVYSYTRPPSNIGAYCPWYSPSDADRPGDWRELIPAEVTAQGRGIVAYLSGRTSPEEAAKLVGLDIAIRREQLPALPDGEHYWTDLIGLEAVTPGGERLGCVVDLMETGVHDVLVVQGPRRHFIPFVIGVYVHRVDIAHRRIELNWGLDY